MCNFKIGDKVRINVPEVYSYHHGESTNVVPNGTLEVIQNIWEGQYCESCGDTCNCDRIKIELIDSSSGLHCNIWHVISSEIELVKRPRKRTPPIKRKGYALWIYNIEHKRKAHQ